VDGPLHPGIAEMLTLAGFSYVYFAEGFCSGVAYSERVNDEAVFGNPETTAETLARAITRFDAALASPGAAPEEMNAAAVGRGRALLNQGQYAAAAAAVQSVPTDFEYLLEHAPAPLRLRNSIYLLTNGGQWSIADGEGGNGLSFLNGDPRVPFIDEQAPGLDNSTPQFSLIKFPDVSASVPLASGIEARLIEAEAAFHAGAFGPMMTFLNDLRDLISLPNLADPGTAAGRVDLIFSERAFWLFATGHRLGDMRRLTRSTLYARAITSVFPEGPYHKGGSYGTDVNMPLPLEERNNPNVNGCLDRDP
jgi:starch-binding outer membrane protein, SusD/RagB family